MDNLRITNRASHQNRDDLTGEHRIGDAGQIILALVFLTVWILDSFVFNYTTYLNQYVPLIIRLSLGILLLAMSGYIGQKGHSTVFSEKRDPPVVIRKSIFNIVRHPIYLSEIILYLAFIVISISLASIAVWVMAIGFLYYISRFEEKLLIARFGDEYRQYMREVPMWIPRLPRYREGPGKINQEDSVIKSD